MLQVLREGEVARRQRRGAGRVERRRLLGGEARVGQEERGAIDAVPAQLAPVFQAGWHELERHSELQELRLVALQLALGGLAPASVVVGESLAQIGERHRLRRVEKQRDQVEEPLGAVHLRPTRSRRSWGPPWPPPPAPTGWRRRCRRGSPPSCPPAGRPRSPPPSSCRPPCRSARSRARSGSP